MPQISVWIGNYGAYNAGYLVGRWVDLPLRPSELEDILEGIRAEAELATGEVCEEMGIFDYDGYPFGLGYGDVFNEYTSVYSLNALATLMESHPQESEVVADAVGTGSESANSVLGLCNWILQSEDIPYYAYDIDQNLFQNDSAETKMGYHCAITSGLYDHLDERDLLSYFDFEKYGRDMGQDCYLGDEGFVDGCSEMPPEDAYSWDEIRRICFDPAPKIAMRV